MTAPAPQCAHVVRRGAGLPVVALHGNGVDHRLLLALDEALDVEGVERVYLDLPGFGRTPALDGKGDLPQLTRWLLDELDVLVPEGRFALLGNSLGGLLARHVQARRADRVAGLALIAPVVDPDQERRVLPERQVLERDDELLASLDDDDRERFEEMAVRLTRPVWERFSRHALPGIEVVDKDAMKALGGHYDVPGDPEDRPTFDGPTLIVTGRQDHVVGFRDQFDLLEHYPRATYAVLDGAGHNVHLDEPERVEALVSEWARSLPRG